MAWTADAAPRPDAEAVPTLNVTRPPPHADADTTAPFWQATVVPSDTARPVSGGAGGTAGWAGWAGSGASVRAAPPVGARDGSGSGAGGADTAGEGGGEDTGGAAGTVTTTTCRVGAGPADTDTDGDATAGRGTWAQPVEASQTTAPATAAATTAAATARPVLERATNTARSSRVATKGA
jgi:hypothetical protein